MVLQRHTARGLAPPLGAPHLPRARILARAVALSVLLILRREVVHLGPERLHVAAQAAQFLGHDVIRGWPLCQGR